MCYGVVPGWDTLAGVLGVAGMELQLFEKNFYYSPFNERAILFLL